MIVKFILTATGVVFGNRDYRDDYHNDVARRNFIDKQQVRGGGIADLSAKRIFGTSYGFGPYSPEVVRQLLPDWQVDPPSDY